MKKTLLQGIIIIVSFFGLLLVVRQINWMSLFKIEKVTASTEEKLGKIFLDIFQNADKSVDNEYIQEVIDTIVNKITEKNNIDRQKIKIQLLENSEINAFALPGSHLVIYTGLLKVVENPEELFGIIAHEIAHIELDHVMKKLIRETGLSVLLSITTGNGGGDMAKNAAKVLSSTAFDRTLESEADIKAVEYLMNAEVDPEPFATFLFRLSTDEPAISKSLTWINSHPGSEERASAIIEAASSREYDKLPLLSDSSWVSFKDFVETNY